MTIFAFNSLYTNKGLYYHLLISNPYSCSWLAIFDEPLCLIEKFEHVFFILTKSVFSLASVSGATRDSGFSWIRDRHYSVRSPWILEQSIVSVHHFGDSLVSNIQSVKTVWTHLRGNYYNVSWQLTFSHGIPRLLWPQWGRNCQTAELLVASYVASGTNGLSWAIQNWPYHSI